MEIEKYGLIFNGINPANKDSVGFAALPVAYPIGDSLVRLYYSYRDSQGRSIPTFMEVDMDDEFRITYQHNRPILELGALGSFDDNGIMPSSIIRVGDEYFLYYIGWSPQSTVSYKLAIGLAVSNDGISFRKYSNGPLLDRDITEPYFNTAPHVIKDGDLFRMWYVSCTKWEIINGWPEPFYLVKSAESTDGINWVRTGEIAIDYDSFTDAIGKPFVFKENNKYYMIYSYRSSVDYRTDPSRSYRLGLAVSNCGHTWERKDEELDLKCNADAWESIMQEYSSLVFVKGEKYLFYNGNGFGRTGIGLAKIL